MTSVSVRLLLVGALDTKLCEYSFLADRLRALSPASRLVCLDLSVPHLSEEDLQRRRRAFSTVSDRIEFISSSQLAADTG
eukprot:CAMPEP_0174241730 /NCGR_PEP_ID=MMETSP0417-20130205/24585_1 /TAXON_ID=242541 /ORGANISM="Mayorella sp, Strain BSH-02190019" /LENGTH=79 /DNA_ID=CAMNT_0015321017 /DNA_START=6 /DNA_END=241 /DNA_ORIENTATION=+